MQTMRRRSRFRPRRREERRFREDAAAVQPFGTAERRHEDRRLAKSRGHHCQTRVLAYAPGEEPSHPDRDPFAERARKSAQTAPVITDNQMPSDDASPSALVWAPPLRRPTLQPQSATGLENALGPPVASATAPTELAPHPPRVSSAVLNSPRPGSGILSTAQDLEARRKSAAEALRKTMASADYTASMNNSVCPRCGSVRPMPTHPGAPALCVLCDTRPSQDKTWVKPAAQASTPTAVRAGSPVLQQPRALDSSDDVVRRRSRSRARRRAVAPPFQTVSVPHPPPPSTARPSGYDRRVGRRRRARAAPSAPDRTEQESSRTLQEIEAATAAFFDTAANGLRNLRLAAPSRGASQLAPQQLEDLRPRAEGELSSADLSSYVPGGDFSSLSQPGLPQAVVAALHKHSQGVIRTMVEHAVELRLLSHSSASM